MGLDQYWPAAELIVKSNGDLSILCDLADSVDTQMDHAISNHMSDLGKGTDGKLTLVKS